MIALLIGAGLALLFALVGTPLFIRLLVRKSYGQFIRDDGPTSHHTKRGTPTMGGTVVVLAVLLSYGLTHLIMWMMNPRSAGPSASALLLLFLMVGMGLVGFLDDFIKISRQRSLGLDAKAKLILQARRGHHLRRPGPELPRRGRAHAGVHQDLPGPRHPVAGPGLRRHRARRHPVRAVVQPDRHRGHQRREPHRRPGRARRRRLGHGLRRLHADGHLAEQPGLRLARGRPAAAATPSGTRWTWRSWPPS